MVELVVGGARLLALQADVAAASLPSRMFGGVAARAQGNTCTILLPHYSPTTAQHSSVSTAARMFGGVCGGQDPGGHLHHPAARLLPHHGGGSAPP